MLKSQKKKLALDTKPQVSSKSSRAAKKQSLKITTIVSAQASAAEKISAPSQAVVLDSKQSRMIMLLQNSGGATIEELVTATGWQAHSVRGAMSGALKKRLGFVIASDVKEHGRVYRITGSVSRS